MQPVTGLRYLHDDTRFVVSGRLLQHGLVQFGIESDAVRLDRHTVVLLEHGHELLAHQAKAFQEALGIALFFGRFDRAVDVIDDRQQIADQCMAA